MTCMTLGLKRRSVYSLWVGCAVFLLAACGQPKAENSETQGWLPWASNEPVKIMQTESGDPIPERVQSFLDSAEKFGRGVTTYRLGSHNRSVTDCSGFVGQAHRNAGYGVALYQFDWDMVNFSGCTGQLRAGDVLLLAYPGRQPDHWIMMADVRAPNGKFNSAENIIMDVSSDYVDGKPFYKGPLSRRRNLLARNVYACRRHRSFERDWKQMQVQLQEQARQAQNNNPQNGPVDSQGQQHPQVQPPAGGASSQTQPGQTPSDGVGEATQGNSRLF